MEVHRGELRRIYKEEPVDNRTIPIEFTQLLCSQSCSSPLPLYLPLSPLPNSSFSPPRRHRWAWGTCSSKPGAAESQNSVREYWIILPPLLLSSRRGNQFWSAVASSAVGGVNRITRASLCMWYPCFCWLVFSQSGVWGYFSEYNSSWGDEHIWSEGRACFKRGLKLLHHSLFMQPSVNTMLAGLLLHWHGVSYAFALVSNHDIWTLSKKHSDSLLLNQAKIPVWLFPCLCGLCQEIQDYCS